MEFSGQTFERAPVANLRLRIRAGLTHLMISFLLVSGCAALVFLVWYPGDFRELAGGRELFLLMASVDVVLGPLLTTAVFDLRKGWPVLRRDLMVIGTCQLLALGYGLYVSSQARPVALVFEVDRFKVIVANDVLTRELPSADAAYQSLPWMGPWTLGTRASRPDETVASIDLALQGFDLAQRPSYWQPYDLSRTAALHKAKPVARLQQHYPGRQQELNDRLVLMHVSAAQAVYLPLVSKADAWVVILKPDGDVAGFAPYDGFF